jgi:hypothetical protein
LGAPVVAGVTLKEVFGRLEQKDEALKLVRSVPDRGESDPVVAFDAGCGRQGSTTSRGTES